MASITQGTDPILAMPREFSSFFNNIEEQAGMESNTIQNIDQFRGAIEIIIDRIKGMSTEDLPDEISKTNVTKFLQKKAMTEGGNGINMLGGIIMANICKKKLLEIAEKADTMHLSDLARARIVEIFNKTFVEAFSQPLPFRDIDISVTRRGTQAQVQGNQKLAEEGKTAEADDTGEDTGSGSYTQFFNNLFKLTNGRFKWRSDILAPVSNDLQCLRAMGSSSAASTVHDLHNSGQVNCYICGCQIKQMGGKNGQWKMQCEHILPIITALAHWWLVKPDSRLPSDLVESGLYTQEQVDILSEEYAWSHACCNLIKNNWEIVSIGIDCRPNSRGISYLLQAIWEGLHPVAQFDCAEVNKTTGKCLTKLSKTKWPNNFIASDNCKTQKQAVIRRLNVICSTISNNIETANNNQIYSLLTKFKVMSAITDADFLHVLLNTNEKTDAVQALADSSRSQLKSARDHVQLAINNVNSNTDEAGAQGQQIRNIDINIDSINNQIKDHKKKIDNSNRARSIRQKLSEEEEELLNQEIRDFQRQILTYEEQKMVHANNIQHYQRQGPILEVAMMNMELTYLENDKANEFLYFNEHNKKWYLSGQYKDYLDNEEKKRRYISELTAAVRDDGNAADDVEMEAQVEAKSGDSDDDEDDDEDDESQHSLAQEIAPILGDKLAAYATRTSRRRQGLPPENRGLMGGRKSIYKTNTNIVNPDVIVPNPDIIKPDPNVIVPNPDIIKPDPNVVEPSPDIVNPDPNVVEPTPDMEPQIDEEVSSSDASGSSIIEPTIKSYTQEQIEGGASELINMALSIRNSIIFRNLLNDVEGPSIEDIKNEVIRIFTTEPDSSTINEINATKLKSPIDEEFVSGDFSKSGGKTRKRKRKSKKKTKKRTNKRRRKKGKKNKKRNTRRRKNKSTKKRRKH